MAPLRPTFLSVCSECGAVDEGETMDFHDEDCSREGELGDELVEYVPREQSDALAEAVDAHKRAYVSLVARGSDEDRARFSDAGKRVDDALDSYRETAG